MTNLMQLCKDLEHCETPEWAAKAILKKEILTKNVVDPCAGTGVLATAAKEAGYKPIPFDVHNWGCPGTRIQDFLVSPYFPFKETTVFMNPPFSEACEFVEKSIDLGARKIVCFQRFAWWESRKRKAFWENYPPSRVYICGDRATCWRHDIPESERINGTTTAHAWFIFEPDNKSGTQLLHIWKDGE